MTTLIQNYNKKTYVIGLKKAYNSILNGFNLIKLHNNVLSLEEIDWNINNTSIDGKNFISPYERNIYLLYKEFNGAEYQEPLSNKCEYSVYYSMLDKSADSKLNNYNLCSDGGFISSEGILYAQNGNKIYVDVNSPKRGPNMQGRDIFLFYIDTKKSIVYGRPGWNLGIGYCMTEPLKSYSVWGSYCTARVLAEDAMNY